MVNANVHLVCYCDGELVDADRNARYIGGHTKVLCISTAIGFPELKDWVREVCDLQLDPAEFSIKCRYRVDDHTVIAIDVDDDQSLKFVIDQSQNCNAIIAYVVEKVPKLMNSALVRKATCDGETQAGPSTKEVVDVPKPIQGAKSVIRGAVRGGRWGYRGRGSSSTRGKNPLVEDPKGKDEARFRPRKQVGRPPGSRMPVRVARRCQICKGYGHNKLTCPRKDDDNKDEDNGDEVFMVEKIDTY